MGGRRAWSSGPCALLLLSAVLPKDAAAMFHGNGKREYVHKVYKVKITEDHLSQDTDLLKRAKNQCPTSYNLCPSSEGGDCCPENYACAKSSCYATTAAVSTCAGQASLYACPFSAGGGCCPQGSVCGSNGACNPPAGATYSQTCGTGYSLCPASLNGGCCQSGMACGTAACFNPEPSTSIIVVATSQDGSATTIISTSVFTPTAEASDNTAGVVAKVYPSTYPKEAATEGDDSSSGGASSGLSKGAIGGIVGGAAAVLLIFLAVAYFIVKRLKRTELAVQSRRETTSGSGTRNTEKKSATQVSITRVQPTPSEVDAMDCDPLMMSSSVASPRGPNQQHLRQGNGRSRSGSDALSLPSGYSSTAPGVRWNTPSVDSDGDSNSKEYFTLPPRVHNQPGGASGDMRRASEASSNYSYHRFAYARHGRNYSNASELSNGSDEPASRHGMGSPLIGPTAELSSDGGFVPELPGSDTETESSNGNNGRRPPARGGEPRRRSTGVVSPMSTTGAVNKPPLTHANLARRRGSSLGSSVVSPMDGQNGNGAGGGGGGGGARGRSDSSVLAPDQRLGSIDESATTTTTAGAPPATNSMHGYFGSPTTAVGQTAAGTRANFASPPLPGFVSLGPAPLDQTEEDYEGNDEKGHQ